MAHKRRSSNDPKISKSFADVNKIFNIENALQRQQREAAERAKRTERLREQADEIMLGPGQVRRTN